MANLVHGQYRTRFVTWLRLGAASAVIVAPMWAATRIDPNQGYTLANEKVRMRFAPGGMGLMALVDAATGRDHLARGPARKKLWELTFATGLLHRKVANTQFPCTQASIDRLSDGTQHMVMEWVDIRWFKEARALTVRVTVDLPPADGVARWRIAVENRSDQWGLWSIAFPQVGGLPAKGQYDIARPAFSRGGLLLPKWTRPVTGKYPSGEWSMQLVTMTHDTDSVYLAAEDSDGRRKDFEVDPPAESVQLLNYPEGMGVAGTGYPDVYPVAFGVFQGDWREAAARYRIWAIQQKWAGELLSKRAQWSKRLARIGYWLVYDFPLNDPEDVPVSQLPATLESIRKKLDTEIGVHWYRWHQTTFDNLYPDFFPAKPGFGEMAAELVKRGFLVMPYINGVSVDRSLPDFEKYRDGAVKDPAGGLPLVYYLETSGRLLAMCAQDRNWQSTVANLVRRLGEEGHVNGVYIDQISAYRADLCFDARHGHPVGGGDYWMRGYRDMLRRVRAVAKTADREIAITSEAPNEVYLDLLDANLTWGEYTGFEIPMFEMVYSGHTVSFGSVCALDRSEQFFRRMQGTATLDGRQLGWLSTAVFAKGHEAKVAYLHDAVAFRKLALDYLLYGQMLRPLSPSSPAPGFKDSAVLEGQRLDVDFAGAEARVFRGEDGRVAILFGNFLDRPVKFPYHITASELGLGPGTYMLSEVTAGGRSRIATFEGRLERVEALRPLGFRMIEITPAPAH